MSPILSLSLTSTWLCSSLTLIIGSTILSSTAGGESLSKFITAPIQDQCCCSAEKSSIISSVVKVWPYEASNLANESLVKKVLWWVEVRGFKFADQFASHGTVMTILCLAMR